MPWDTFRSTTSASTWSDLQVTSRAFFALGLQPAKLTSGEVLPMSFRLVEFPLGLQRRSFATSVVMVVLE